MRHLVTGTVLAILILGSTGASTHTASAQVVTGPPTVIEGTLFLIVEDDFAHGRANKRYFLDERGSAGRHELKLSPHQAATLQPGMKVRVTGRFSGDMLGTVAPDESVVLLDAPAATTPIGVRKVLILLVDIVDNNVKHAISANCDGSMDTAAANAFGFRTTGSNVDGCYQDSSYGNLGWGGASYPGTDADVQRVTITDSVAACDYTSWGSKADALASNLGSYQHRLYVVPSDVNCGWAGLAYVASCPGTYCQAWVKAYSYQECGYPDAMAHEVGHNVGWMHASWDTNNDGSIDCEYCDDQDFMGYAEGMLRPVNGPHRVQMGWVSGAGVVDASASGQFTLSPLNQPAAPLPQVATITAANGYPYYVSYRVASGYDSFIASTVYSSTVLNSLSIHRWPGGISNTLFVASLDDGQVFTDATNNLTIVQDSHTDTSVTFTVSIGLLAPTNLTATAGDTQVALSWTASNGATGYNVKRADVSGGPYTPVAANVAATGFVDMAVVNGQTYSYVVSAVDGTNESPNSLQVTATPNFMRPDLIESAAGTPPATVAVGASFSASDTVKNNGTAAAGASSTRYYLSADQSKDAGDILLNGSRSVGTLAVGQTSNGSAAVSLPSTTPGGTYYLLTCADDLAAVPESDETNNCRASATTFQVTSPDLIVTALTIPTSPVAAGGTFKMSDTVKNQGTVAAGAFTNRYYLSLDQSKDGGDVLLSGTATVSSLGAGQSMNDSVTVTVPSATPVGTYYVLSCADDLKAVGETNETNNCRTSSGTIHVVLPDLVVTVLTIPTAPVAVGGTFKISDTMKNQGTVTAGASTRRYYLSLDASQDAGDLLLGGSVSNTSLAAGQTSSGNVTVTAPAATPAGTYYVLSCADDLNAVSESNESNNCKTSASTIQVARADLVITAVTNPPATAAVGGTFKVTDTVKNQGTVAARASTTRYYLSADQQRDAGDILLNGTRSISSLNAGSTSSGNANVTIAAGTPVGTYYVLSCADDVSVVPESDETNNCRASTSAVAVH